MKKSLFLFLIVLLPTFGCKKEESISSELSIIKAKLDSIQSKQAVAITPPYIIIWLRYDQIDSNPNRPDSIRLKYRTGRNASDTSSYTLGPNYADRTHYLVPSTVFDIMEIHAYKNGVDASYSFNQADYNKIKKLEPAVPPSSEHYYYVKFNPFTHVIVVMDYDFGMGFIPPAKN